MKRASTLLSVIALLVASHALGQEVAIPTTIVADGAGRFHTKSLQDHLDPRMPGIDSYQAARVAALKQRIEAIDAKNSPQEAATLQRQLATLEVGVMQELLDKKQKEIDQLKLEVDALRRPHDRVLVQVAMRAIEVSLAKLRASGMEARYAQLLRKSDNNRAFQVLDDASDLESRVQELITKEIARVIAEPTLCTMNGQSVCYVSGGEVPAMQVRGEAWTPERMLPFGTMASAMPVLQKDGSLRLTFSFEQREIDRSLGFKQGKFSAPGFRTRQFGTSSELRSGQLLVMSGMRSERKNESTVSKFLSSPPEELEMLLLVRPTYPVEALGSK